jgi:hypothetical protein
MKNAVFWDLLTTEAAEQRIAVIIRVTIIGYLGTTLAVTSNGTELRRNITINTNSANVVPSLPVIVTLMMGAIRSSETSVVTKATPRYIP